MMRAMFEASGRFKRIPSVEDLMPKRLEAQSAHEFFAAMRERYQPNG